MKLLICILSLLGVALTAVCPAYTCENTPEIQLDAKAEAEKSGEKAFKNWDFFQDMNRTGQCYQHSLDDPVTHIRTAKCMDPESRCFVGYDPTDYAWVTSRLQFTPQKDRKMVDGEVETQVLNKITSIMCAKKKHMKRNMYNGRKCENPYQCVSGVCDSETKSCVGRAKGDSCSSHIDCSSGLACRPSTKWPFATQCLALADVGSECETKYDCKPRNFCWKLVDDKTLVAEKTAVCLERHSAPDDIKFSWDSEKYPAITKESIMAHGTYCKSGTAYRLPSNKDVAVCVSINRISQTTVVSPSTIKSGFLDAKLNCIPDGEHYCHYAKQKSGASQVAEVKFSLPCECGLYKDSAGNQAGHCPIPKYEQLQLSQDTWRKMALSDQCHTYDRNNFEAQVDCGIAFNLEILSMAIKNFYITNYFPSSHNDEVSECIQNFLPYSYRNIFSGAQRVMASVITATMALHYII